MFLVVSYFSSEKKLRIADNLTIFFSGDLKAETTGSVNAALAD